MKIPIKYIDVTSWCVTLVYRMAGFVYSDDILCDIYILLKWLVIIIKPRYILSFKAVDNSGVLITS